MTASIPDNIFRAYDIRGIVNQGLDVPLMTLIGKAIASEALTQGEHCLVVAADARLSSPAFSQAMIAGIITTGCDVIHIGTVPTPLLYFATHHFAKVGAGPLTSRSGVMITGSHNPKNYNGVKIVLQNNCLAADQIQRLKQRIQAGDFHEGEGNVTTADVMPAYLKRIDADLCYSRPYRVVIDCGNGVAANCAPMLFAALGCEVEPLFCTTDGSFPNHHPDPTQAENLAALKTAVLETQADLGIAFDGDGDRVGLVSPGGHIIDADSMMLAFIADILPENPGASIVFDVKSSLQLKKLITRLGGTPVMCKSGHSFVKREMQATGALLGGEFSAHLFFRHRWYGFDDGMYAAARFLELLDRKNCSADTLLDSLGHRVSTPEIKLEVNEREKFSIMANLQENLEFPGALIIRVDGVRAETDKAWGLVRASNTTPNLVLRFEAESVQALQEIQETFKTAIGGLVPGLCLDCLPTSPA